jgi:phosphinothricin acetyltransferase
MAATGPTYTSGMTKDVTVRAGRLADLQRLTDIYNHYVIETPTTFDTVPFTVEQRREWFGHYHETGRHRLIVAERDGVVMGYTTSSPFSDRAAYDTTVETTILCAPEFVGQGIGKLLYGALFDALAPEDVHSALARVTLPNKGSHDIHLHFGFREMGIMREAGRKFGKYWDVAFYQKMMSGP